MALLNHSKSTGNFLNVGIYILCAQTLINIWTSPPIKTFGLTPYEQRHKKTCFPTRPDTNRNGCCDMTTDEWQILGILGAHAHGELSNNFQESSLPISFSDESQIIC